MFQRTKWTSADSSFFLTGDSLDDECESEITVGCKEVHQVQLRLQVQRSSEFRTVNLFRREVHRNEETP